MTTNSLFGALSTLAAAGCGSAQSPATFDAGSIALPQSVSTSEFRCPAPVGFDTGNMSLPTVQRHGQAVPAVSGPLPDAGSMALPNARGTGVILPGISH